MRRRVLPSVLGVVVGATLVAAPVVSADPGGPSQERQCELLPARQFRCVNRHPGDEPAAVAPAKDTARTRPLGTWDSYETEGPEAGVAGGIVDCGLEPDGVTPVAARAVEFIDSEGNTAFLDYVCPPPAGASPALPPPPPGPAEVLGEAPLPEPVIGISPDSEGLTGLETWLWGNDPGPVPVIVSLRGYTVTGTARIARWTWTMGDPAGGFRQSFVPGSEAHPAATYTYETKGQYTVLHATHWEASFTVTGWGLSGVTVDAGDLVIEASRPYTVVEVRSVRRTPE